MTTSSSSFRFLPRLRRILPGSVLMALFFLPWLPADAQDQGAHSKPTNDAWPFARNQTGPGRAEDASTIGLFNEHIGLLLRKSDATILGVWDARGWNLVAHQDAAGTPPFPLWSLELMPDGAQKPVATDALKAAPASYRFVEGNGNATALQIRFPAVQAGESRCEVTATVSLAADDLALRWRIDAKMLDKKSGVWSVRYPLIQVRAADENDAGNQTVFPYRQGRAFPYGKSQPRFDLIYPYPGPGAKFQFLAAYGEASRRGFYLAAEDGAGYDKQMVWQNQPVRDTVVFSIEHIPTGRGVSGTDFNQPYDVVTRPFTGDWYDAARIYRSWWTRQIWASKGLMRDRRDVPEWLKRTPVMTRPSTTNPIRTVPRNVESENKLQEILGGDSYAGIWYGAYENVTGEAGLDHEGHGHLRALRSDVQDAVRTQKARGIHHLAYLQSAIYDVLKTDPADAALAAKHVARARDGKPVMYHDLGYNMDRSTKWWQDRVIEQSEKAVAAGFGGIYLDSFGKGSAECFARDHGHPVGGGNTGITGQRAMAKRVLEAIRKIDPDAVLTGEDPVEAFRDLLHVHLLSANLWPGHLPLYRVIWGDYSLEYGRVLRSGKTGAEDFIPEMATMFVNGHILGRIYTDGGVIFSNPQCARARAAFQEMTGITKHAIEHLRFGEYLRPLRWDAPLPRIEIQETGENSKVVLPVVLHSVTRSYADGSVGVALVNISTQTVELQVPLDPAQRAGESAKNTTATLWRMNAAGEETRIAAGGTAWKLPLSLQPGEIAFLILR